MIFLHAVNHGFTLDFSLVDFIINRTSQQRQCLAHIYRAHRRVGGWGGDTVRFSLSLFFFNILKGQQSGRGGVELAAASGGLRESILGHLHVQVGKREGVVAVVLEVLVGAVVKGLLGLRCCCCCCLCRGGD